LNCDQTVIAPFPWSTPKRVRLYLSLVLPKRAEPVPLLFLHAVEYHLGQPERMPYVDAGHAASDTEILDARVVWCLRVEYIVEV
jgi:hypothetical protein